MSASNEIAQDNLDADRARTMRGRGAQRPLFRASDIWRAPLHDFPVRDEIIYQYLPLSPDMHVLEIGPGSGFTAFRLARHVRHLTLLDIAANNIARLRQELATLPNVSFLSADVCAPGLAHVVGRQVDAAFGLEVFELLPDPAACLLNLVRCCAPAAIFCFSSRTIPRRNARE